MNLLGLHAIVPILAASEFWMTRTLTVFWLFGLGILLGCLVLLAAVAVYAVIGLLPGMRTLQRSGLAFWIGLVAAAVVTASIAMSLRPNFMVGGRMLDDEWLLFTIALSPLIGVVIWGLLYGSQWRFLKELGGSLTQGVGAYIASTLAIIASGGLLCTFLVDEPLEMVKGIPTIFNHGEVSATFPLPAASESEHETNYVPIPLRYDPRYLDRIVVRSKQNIILSDTPTVDAYSRKPRRIQAGEDVVWDRRSTAAPPISLGAGANVYGQNLEIEPAEVTFVITSVPPYPETFTVFVVAAIVTLIGLAWMLQLSAAPKVAAIALSAAKNELSQPLPWILLLFGLVLLVGFVFLPYHTQGEDIKLLKDCGLTLILLICLFQGVWSASSSVSDEIEGRTALTLMSKPVYRRSFIIGKMLGVFWVLLFMILVLGSVFLLSVSYKAYYDALEMQSDAPRWQDCHMETMHTLPGLVMVLLQATTLSALAVALATRLPQLANFAICFTIYLVGHLTPSIVEATAEAFPIIQFVAQLIAVVIPTLDWFSMDKAIDSNRGIPMAYLSGLFVYSLLYTAIAIFLGLLLFEDRDLA
jgi:hypothetical protein